MALGIGPGQQVQHIQDDGLGGLLDGRVVREVLTAFTEVTGLPVTVRDSQGHFFGSPTVVPRWCALLRRSSFGFAGCQRLAVESCPHEPGRVADYTCHETIHHLTAAVVVEGRVLAQLILGPFVEFPISDQTISREAERYGISPDELLASRREVKWQAPARTRAAARLLAAVANAFSRMATDAQERARPAQAAGRSRHLARPRSPELPAHPRALLVEPDAAARQSLARAVGAGGFRVETAATGEEALAALKARPLPDVVVVNPQLRDTPGYQLCHLIRCVADLPIVVLSAVSDEHSVVEALEQFAEDYLVRPVSDRELVARLRRVVRRAGGRQVEREEAPAEGGPGLLPADERLSVNLARREVVVEGRPVRLTPTECRILGCLARRPNRAVPTRLLLQEAWPDGDGDPSQLWVHVRSLRRKLEADPDAPRYLQTIRGQGYALAAGTGRPGA